MINPFNQPGILNKLVAALVPRDGIWYHAMDLVPRDGSGTTRWIWEPSKSDP